MHQRKFCVLLAAGLSLGGFALQGVAAPATDAPRQVQPGQDPKVPRDTKPVPPVPARKEVPIDPKLQDEAREVLTASLNASDRIIRAHAVEAAKQLYGAKAKDDILRALRDPEGVVRFAGAMSVGDIKLAEAKDDVLKLVDDNDPGVRVAVRYALHRLGDVRFSHDLERTAVDPDASVRGNTALVLGRLEVASARKILLPMQRDPDPAVRLQTAEALWKLGDERGFKTLVAASVSGYPDDNIIAFLAMSATKNQKLAGHINAGLTHEYVQVALAAARAMGELGSDMGYGVVLNAVKARDPMIRYMAAMAMGSIGRPDSQEILGDYLKDKDSADVRLAAAFALLQIGATK